MPDTTLHIRIKEKYATALIEVLINEHAVETIEEEEIELTAQQKEALDKELPTIASNSTYLQKWDDIRHRFKKL